MTENEPLQKFLEERFGVHKVKVPKEQWEETLSSRREELGLSQQAYQERVMSSTQEANCLAEKMVIPETWFFREDREIQGFIEWMKEGLERFKKGSPAKVLSLGCSTGEEPYSLAIALKDAFDIPGIFRIEAVDLSSEAIKFAKAGIYGSTSFRGDAVKKYKSYFKEVSSGLFAVPDEVRFLISFKRRNIIDYPQKYQKESYDAIFCRNVLIYFSEATQNQIVDRLIHVLKPEGILVLGEMEAGKLYKKLTRRRFPSSKLYVKEKKEQAREGEPELRRIFRLKEEGSIEEGIRLAEELILKSPTCHEAYRLLGALYHSQGKIQESKRAFEEAINIHAKDVESLTYLYLITTGKEREEFKSAIEKILGEHL